MCHSIQYPDFGCQMPSELQKQQIARQHGGVLLFRRRVKFSHVRESILQICLVDCVTVAHTLIIPIDAIITLREAEWELQEIWKALSKEERHVWKDRAWEHHAESEISGSKDVQTAVRSEIDNVPQEEDCVGFSDHYNKRAPHEG